MDKNDEVELPRDPSSFSRPKYAIITHFDLSWTINFADHFISGSVALHFNVKDTTVNHIVLDTRELTITEVTSGDSHQQLKYEVGPPKGPLGSSLTVSIPSTEMSKKLVIHITYSTTATSTALQWLDPGMTSGKEHPFLFSQCQPIHARSLMPCQDTPQVKATYTAVVRCATPLVALMSALPVHPKQATTDAADKCATYEFRQPVAIPSYLLAIVVGDLVGKEIGPRSKVWGEREVVEKAAFEFAETEKMLKAAESLCGEYLWTQYDLLVLPPSFPYGGMENPCLTFVTPTLLAGDRSLANVIAHEICHSWTGNLVTSCNWEHFWLNEGFTVFLERKVEEKLYGTPARHLSAIEGWDGLKYCIETRGEEDPLTCLIPKLDGIDPDDAFSTVPYEKGHALLWTLETLLGGPDVFDPFLKAYVDKFRHRSIDSAAFKDFLMSYFGEKKEELKSFDWHAWFHTPGMPPCQPKFDTTLADDCYELCQTWKDWDGAGDCPFTRQDLDKFSSKQMVVWMSKFLDCSFPLSKVKRMAAVYQMDKFANSEIRFRWLRLCIQAKWEEKLDDVFTFVNSQGRMKFVRPIYRDLYQWESVREKAVANFHAEKRNMMHVSLSTLAKDLHLREQ